MSVIHVEGSRDWIARYDNVNKYVCRGTHQSWISSSGYDPLANTFGLNNIRYALSRIAYRRADVSFLSSKAIDVKDV